MTLFPKFLLGFFFLKKKEVVDVIVFGVVLDVYSGQKNRWRIAVVFED